MAPEEIGAELQVDAGAPRGARFDAELAVQAACALLHDGQTMVHARVEARAEADAVVFDEQFDLFADLAQIQPGVLGLDMAGAIGERLASDLQQVDLFAGRELEGQPIDLQFAGEFAALGEFFHRVLEFLVEAAVLYLQAEGGEQFAQLPVGGVQAVAQFAADTVEHLGVFTAADQGLQAADLQLLSKGQTVPEFERQLFKLPAGLARQPIESRYGWHVVSIDQRLEGKVLPYEIVAGSIRSLLEQGVWQKAVAQYLQTLIGAADIVGIQLQGADSPLLQ